MHKTSLLLSAGLASLACANPLHAASYADLLTPIENPVAALQADDAARMIQAQYYNYGYGQPGYGYNYGWQGYYGRPRYYHHHHHHHHHHHAYYHHHYPWRGW